MVSILSLHSIKALYVVVSEVRFRVFLLFDFSGPTFLISQRLVSNLTS